MQFVSSERLAAVRAQLVELYRAMDLQVTSPTSVNGFREQEAVQYRLATGPPLTRTIRFFLKLQEEDGHPDSNSFEKTYAVFIEGQPDGTGSERETIHTVPIADLRHDDDERLADTPGLE